MTAKPPPDELRAFLDANPGTYKDAPEADGYNGTQAICKALLTRPLVANPEGQGQVQEPLDVADLYGALTTPEIAAIPEAGFRAISDAINAGDRANVKRWIGIALAKGYIDQAKHDAIVGAVDATIDDPNWQSQVKGQNAIETNWPNEERGLHRKYIHKTVLGRA